MLVSQREDWQHGFKVIDTKNAHYYDKQGRKTDYDTLLAATPPGTEAMVTPEKMSERFDASQAAMDALHERIVAARLDVLLIVGDDQTELFRTSNNPAMAIFYGSTIRNTAREPAAPNDPWPKTARMWRHEPEVDREYPVKSDLAEWLIRQLCDRDFDIAAMDGLEPGQSEGHAFQFIHRRLLKGHELPVIPVILNTFDPPNQPTPRRCVALGRALRELIALWPQDLRVGVIASGGLSHFVVDEELDQQVLSAIRNKDSAALAAAYASGLAQNPPFVDGNKRAAFLSVGLFLGLNGYRLTASQAEATVAVFGLASGDIDEATFAAWLRDRIALR